MNMSHELLGFAAIYEDDSYKHFPVRATENTVESASVTAKGAQVQSLPSDGASAYMENPEDAASSPKVPLRAYAPSLVAPGLIMETGSSNSDEFHQPDQLEQPSMVHNHSYPSFFSQETDPALRQEPFMSQSSYVSQYAHMGKYAEANDFPSQSAYAPSPAVLMATRERVQSIDGAQDYYKAAHLDYPIGLYHDTRPIADGHEDGHDYLPKTMPYHRSAPSTSTQNCQYIPGYPPGPYESNEADPVRLEDDSGSNHSTEPSIRNMHLKSIENEWHGEKKIKTSRQRGNKSKSCPICSKQSRRDLTRHMRTHQATPGYECPFPREICNHRRGQFNRPYEYKKHLIASHFTCNDSEASKNAVNLADKMQLSGQCQCNVSVDSVSSWMRDHIGTGACPLLHRSDDETK